LICSKLIYELFCKLMLEKWASRGSGNIQRAIRKRLLCEGWHKWIMEHRLVVLQVKMGIALDLGIVEICEKS
jgi:hypothetical protein